MEPTPSFTLKKIHLTDLNAWLDIPLPPGSLNRGRNEFMRMIKPFLDDLNESRKEILDQYSDQDAVKDKPHRGPRFKTPEDQIKAEEEFNKVLQEEVVVTVSKPMALTIVREVLKTSTKQLKYDEGTRFDEVCDILGVVVEDKRKTPVDLDETYEMS